MGQSQNVLPKRWPFRKNDINCEKWMHMKTQEGNPLECLHYLCGLCYYFSWLLRPGLRALNLSLILPTVNKLEEAFPWITWNIWREKEETSWHWRHPVERWESWHPQTGSLKPELWEQARQSLICQFISWPPSICQMRWSLVEGRCCFLSAVSQGIRKTIRPLLLWESCMIRGMQIQ